MYILSSLIIFSLTLLAGFPLFYKDHKNFTLINLAKVDAFTRGVFLSVGIIHLLPEAIEHTKFQVEILTVLLLAFTFLLWLEKCLPFHAKNLGATFVLVISLSAHSFIEGFAVGVESNSIRFATLLVAILSHKFIAAFALSLKLNITSSYKQVHKIIYFCIFSAMTPVGIILGNLIKSHIFYHSVIINLINAFAAGTFIYLGSMHDWHHNSKNSNHVQVMYFLIGIATMVVIGLCFPHEHHHHHHH